MLDTAFILAAGLGTRMRPLTRYAAKPSLFFRGERLIERHLRRLALAGFNQVVINCSWQGQQLRQLLGDGSAYNIRISYSCEQQGPLETASGISRAASQIGDQPFLLVNGDVWTDFDYGITRQLQHPPHVFLTANPPHHPQGDFTLDADGYVGTRGEQTFTYTGISVFDLQLLANTATAGEKLGDIFRRNAEKGELHGSMLKAQWLDIGNPAVIEQQLETVAANTA